MDKTFAETQGHAPFDWNKWLDSAIANPPENDDWKEKSSMASEWTTCACGNVCAVIPRSKSTEYDEEDRYIQKGEPIDRELSDLGMEFYGNITMRKWAAAKAALAEIEARSAVLIAEELKNLSSLKFLDTGRDEE